MHKVDEMQCEGVFGDEIKAVLLSQTGALITSANAQKRHKFMFK